MLSSLRSSILCCLFASRRFGNDLRCRNRNWRRGWTLFLRRLRRGLRLHCFLYSRFIHTHSRFVRSGCMQRRIRRCHRFGNVRTRNWSSLCCWSSARFRMCWFTGYNGARFTLNMEICHRFLYFLCKTCQIFSVSSHTIARNSIFLRYIAQQLDRLIHLLSSITLLYTCHSHFARQLHTPFHTRCHLS